LWLNNFHTRFFFFIRPFALSIARHVARLRS
jgi:hypothetical protein